MHATTQAANVIRDIVRGDVNKISYFVGEEILISLTFDDAALDLNALSNISIDLFRIERERNQFAFGFGCVPDCNGNRITVRQKLPSDMPRGLYVISAVTLVRLDSLGASEQKRISFPPICFVVQTAVEVPMSKPDVSKLVAQAESDRARYVHKEHRTVKSCQRGNASKRYLVLIFGVGCLLHATQQLEGFAITPLGRGMSHKRAHEIVNEALRKFDVDELRFDEETERQFEQASPTFVISFPSVLAVDHEDAFEYCRSHAALIFELLGLDRGQKPREFACFAAELDTVNMWYLFLQPWYKGNLVSDFNPVSTANLIELHLPKLQTQPFVRLLLKTFSDATAEDDQGFALLRFWSVLELLSDNRIPNNLNLFHPDGTAILKPNGKAETTGSKHGRVYQWILSNGAYTQTISYELDGVRKECIIGPTGAPPTGQHVELITLWDMVCAAYAIRNSIAHEGQFDVAKAATGTVHQQLAARLTRELFATPKSFVEHHAHLSVLRELNAP